MKSKVLLKTSTMPYQPSPSVLKALDGLRPGRMRLRWSDEEGAWCVEYKTSRPKQTGMVNDKFRYLARLSDGAMVENDQWLAQKDGYVIIGYWPPKPVLSDLHIRHLQANDMSRYSLQELDYQLTQQEVAKKEARRKKRKDFNYDFWFDWYQARQHEVGEKAYVPRIAHGLGS